MNNARRCGEVRTAVTRSVARGVAALCVGLLGCVAGSAHAQGGARIGILVEPATDAALDEALLRSVRARGAAPIAASEVRAARAFTGTGASLDATVLESLRTAVNADALLVVELRGEAPDARAFRVRLWGPGREVAVRFGRSASATLVRDLVAAASEVLAALSGAPSGVAPGTSQAPSEAASAELARRSAVPGGSAASVPERAPASTAAPSALPRVRGTSDRARASLLTPAPEGWNGGVRRRFGGFVIPLAIIGAVLAAGGVVVTILAYVTTGSGVYEYVVTDPKAREVLGGIGPAAIGLGVSLAAVGLILSAFGVPGVPEEAGTVFFSSLRPWVSPMPDGVTAGFGARW